MPIRRIVEKLPPTALKKELPVVFHEPHVESGFRQIHQPWHYYILSLFQMHNECMNAWTHLLGCLIALGRLYKISQEFDAWNDPWMYPMLAGSITMITMYLCSTAAHTFHNMSEQLHYTCFFVDYAGIGVYALGGTIIHYYYCTHISLVGSLFHSYAIQVGVFLAVVVCFNCSYSKTKYSRPYPFTRKIWQVSSILSIYSWLIYPIVHRLFLFAEHPLSNSWDQSLSDHSYQMMWFCLAGIFFSMDVPQRFFPGRCDFLFHGHQIFHVCIMLMNLKQIDGMYSDIKARMSEIKTQHAVPTVWNTFGYVLLAILMNAVVVCSFHYVAKQRIAREAAERQAKSQKTE